MKRYEFIEHTADVAVRVYGGSLKELFTSAALAMFGVLIAKKQNRPQAVLTEISIQKKEESLEDLLKYWLDEMLFYYSAQHLILHRIKTIVIEDMTLEAKILLEPFDAGFYDLKSEIKAVTYHELKVENIRNQWQAKIVFDV